ncbi:MAG: hypothetical protein AAFO94_18725, partial [Bacteroidota bacterium]
MNKYTLLLLPILFTVFSACEDSTLRELDTNTAVVDAYLFAGNSVDSIRVTQSNAYADTDTTLVTLDDLKITLSDGNVAYTLDPIGDGYYKNTDL